MRKKYITFIVGVSGVCSLIIVIGILAVKEGRAKVNRAKAQAYAENVQREVMFKKLERKLRLTEATLSTALCENGGRLDGVGDGGRSHGFLQVQKATFYDLAGKAGIKGLYWKNPYHQVKVFQWAIENGYGKKWACYQEVK